VPNYTFKTVKKADGSLGYFVNGTELQDKESYDRIKQRADQVSNQAMQEAEDQFMPEINTKRQYESEKNAGDPNAVRLSYDEWKQL
jgi:hypothetical protein